MLNKEIFIIEKINDFNEAKNLLEKYLDKKISINKLKKNYFIDDIKFIKEELEKAYLFKDKTKLDILFWLIFTFDLYSEISYVRFQKKNGVKDMRILLFTLWKRSYRLR